MSQEQHLPENSGADEVSRFARTTTANVLHLLGEIRLHTKQTLERLSLTGNLYRGEIDSLDIIFKVDS